MSAAVIGELMATITRLEAENGELAGKLAETQAELDDLRGVELVRPCPRCGMALAPYEVEGAAPDEYPDLLACEGCDAVFRRRETQIEKDEGDE